MDNKRLIFVILLSMVIVFGWNIFLTEMGKRNNWANPNQQQPQTQPVAQQQNPASTANTTSTTVHSGVENVMRASAGEMRVLNAPSATRDALLGSNITDDPTWAMGIETTGHGASIARITLNEFPRDVKRNAPYVFQETPAIGAASMATLWVEINKQRVELSNANWTLAKREPNACDYTVDIGKEQPLLRIHKYIELTPKNNAKEAPETGGYQVNIRHKVENLTSDAMDVQFGLAGPTMLPREVDRGPDRYVLAAYNDDPAYTVLSPVSWDIETLTGDKQTLAIEKSKEGWPVIWAGMTSTYFDAIVYPVPSRNNRVTADFMSNVQARSVDPSAVAKNIQAELLFTTKPLRVEAQKPAEFSMEVFFGPKMRALVKNNYYGVYPRQFNLSLTTSSSCAWCTFPWLVNSMVMLLRGLHFVVRDWGLAIIGLVLVVRLVLHPLTRKSTISMHKMQKLAPEMERLKKKYADNSAELNRAMMQFYKEHGASQVLGCLPMFLQMPIWVALWSALQGTFELRLAPFLWGFTWIKDLAKPDHLITFQPVQLLFFQLDAVNILPILLAVVFFFQQKYQPQPPATTPEQEQQRKMMQWMMPVLFPLMLYTGPAGLNLYILTSTTMGILESKMIRDHIKAREAAEAAAGPVIIDAPTSRAGRRRLEDDREPKAPKKGIAAWFEKLQKMAAEAQKQQQKRKGK